MKNSNSLSPSMQKRCFSLVRDIEEILPQEVDNHDIIELGQELSKFKNKLFSGSTEIDEIIRAYQALKYRFDALTSSGKVTGRPRPIGLQMATVDEILPVNLKWQEFVDECEFLIETAELRENQMPVWREYAKTTSNRMTIRDLQKGKTYWFRISKLPKIGV